MHDKTSALTRRLAGGVSVGKDTGGGRLTTDAVARRAFELYEQRGRENGHDMDDWLRAERELTRHFAPRDSSTGAHRIAAPAT
jgi:hypothetical protein